MDSLKAFGRAFGKPSSLFIASWPLVLRRPVELAREERTHSGGLSTSQFDPKETPQVNLPLRRTTACSIASQNGNYMFPGREAKSVRDGSLQLTT